MNLDVVDEHETEIGEESVVDDVTEMREDSVVDEMEMDEESVVAGDEMELDEESGDGARRNASQTALRLISLVTMMCCISLRRRTTCECPTFLSESNSSVAAICASTPTIFG